MQLFFIISKLRGSIKKIIPQYNWGIIFYFIIKSYTFVISVVVSVLNEFVSPGSICPIYELIVINSFPSLSTKVIVISLPCSFSVAVVVTSANRTEPFASVCSLILVNL